MQTPARPPGYSLEYPPVEPNLPALTSRDVADHDPLLVGWGALLHVADRHRFQPAGVAGMRVAACLAIGVQLNGPVDRDAVPVGEDHPGREVGIREAGDQLRDHVPVLLPLEELLDEEGEERGLQVPPRIHCDLQR